MQIERELVLLPGLNNTAVVFDGLLAALPAAVHAQALEHPTLTSVEEITRALLVQLPPRFWLAGFSFGGYVAMAMLEAAPQRIEGIALICSSPLADTPAQSEKRRVGLETARSGGYEAMIATQAANAFHPDSLANAALMATRMDMVRAYGAARFIAHTEATIQRPDRSHLLDGRIPTAVITASHDNVLPPAGIAAYAARIPNVSYSVIEGAGHLLPIEQPQALARALCAWMRC